jgi:hypothetical protein
MDIDVNTSKFIGYAVLETVPANDSQSTVSDVPSDDCKLETGLETTTVAAQCEPEN